MSDRKVWRDGLESMASWAVVVVLSMGLVSCSDDPEMQRQQAQIALDNGKPDLALRLANKVLAHDENDAVSQGVRASALIRLNRFDKAEAALAWLDEHNADTELLEKIQREWFLGRLQQLLAQPDFASSNERQAQFDKALEAGHEMSQDAPMIIARLYELDAARLQQVMSHREKTSSHIQAIGGSDAMKALRAERDARLQYARDSINEALKTEPNNLDALAKEASYAGRAGEWPRLWEVANQVGELDEIPASVVAGMIVRLTQIPSQVAPLSARVELAKKIKKLVRDDERESVLMDMSAARIAIMNNDSDAAIAPLEAVIKAEPQNIDARFMLATMLLSKGELKKSESMLFRLISEAPNTARIHALYGKALMEQGDLTRASKALEKAVSLDKDDAVARATLTRLMVLRGELTQAHAQAEQTYANNPTDARAVRGMIELAQQQGRRDEVERVLSDLETSMSIEAMSEAHLVLMIEGYRYLRRGPQVFQYATVLAERRPEASEAQIILADALLEGGDEETARRILEEVKKKDASLPSVNRLMGQLHLGRYAFLEAARVLKLVIEADPNDIDARLDMVSALAGAGQFDQALDELDNGLERQPDSQAAHRLACRIYQMLGRRDKVNEHLSHLKLDQLDPIRDASMLAQAKLNEGDSDEALRICGSAVASGQNDPVLRMMMSRIYQERGQASDAEAQLIALVRQSPNNPQSYSILTNYYQQFDAARGVAELDRLVALNVPFVRLSQAALLQSMNKNAEGIALLEPVLTSLVKARHVMVLAVAETLSDLYVREKQLALAARVYTRLIDAGITPLGAKLSVVELKIEQGDLTSAGTTLDELTGELPVDDEVLFRRAAGLYARLGSVTRAMPLIMRWREAHPEDGASYAWEAAVAASAGEAAVASSAFAKAIELSPGNLALRQYWAETLIDERDYANAEAVLSEMAELGGEAALLALTSKARLYLSVGLDREAARTVDMLDGKGSKFDSQLTLGIGRAYYTLERYDDARTQLLEIGESLPEYGPAQVLLSRIDVIQGDDESARERIIALAKSPSGRMTAEREINQLRFNDSGEKRLLMLIDGAVDLTTLPAAIRGRWAARRARLSADRGQWLEALNASALWTAAMPNDIEPWAVRLALLVQLDRRDEVIRELSRQVSWSQTPFGQLAAVAVGGQVGGDGKPTYALAAFLDSMASDDRDGAAQATEMLGASVMIFQSDLRAMVAELPRQALVEKDRSRRLAAALLSMQAGLSRMALEQAQAVVSEMPTATLGYAIMMQSKTAMDESIDGVIAALKKHARDSVLLPYVEHRLARDEDRIGQAAQFMEQVLEREPNNVHVQYAMTELWHLSGDVDRALAGLEPLSQKAGPYQFASANDFAYLLAENRSDRLDEAKKMAEQAHASNPEAAALLDTLGWIEHLQGDHEQSLRRLNQAVVALRDVPQVHYHLAQVYRSLGNDRWMQYHLEAAADGPENLPESRRARALLANVSN